ncbi:CNH domain-containing protein [Mycena haematopus]|nr:CNH domain-containing protein [Mycena haematopus]
MAEAAGIIVGAGATIAAVGAATSAGFTGRHESSHRSELAEMDRNLHRYRSASLSGSETSLHQDKDFYKMLNESQESLKKYHQSIEDYKEVSWVHLPAKFKKRKAVRKAKKASRHANQELREHVDEVESDVSDGSSTDAESGSPPRSPSGRLPVEPWRILYWQDQVQKEAQKIDARSEESFSSLPLPWRHFDPAWEEGEEEEALRESLGDAEPNARTPWVHSVPANIAASVSDAEKKRQEAINEVISTERDFGRDMEYLRRSWIVRITATDITPAERRKSIIRVFSNVQDVIKVNTKLRDALNKRQRANAVVEKIGDIFADAVPHFESFVIYAKNQRSREFRFRFEQGANPAFKAFVEATEQLPESRGLKLDKWLMRPTMRLAQYPLLLEAVLKHTPDSSPDKLILPQVVATVREFLSRAVGGSSRAENRSTLARLRDTQLRFQPGEQVDLRLWEGGRELVYQGLLSSGPVKYSKCMQVYLFDHVLLFEMKELKVQTDNQYLVYRRPIPLELLVMRAPESTNGTDTVDGYAQNVRHFISFEHLGRKPYRLVLWADSALSQRQWLERIFKQQKAILKQNMVFNTIALSKCFFGSNKVNCAAPFSDGQRIAYGTNDAVYISDLRDISKDPLKVPLTLPDVRQIEILEDYHLVIVLSARDLYTFPLDMLDHSDRLKYANRISTQTSFFKTGFCLGRVLVCIVGMNGLASTFKVVEPIKPNLRAKPTFKKLLQGGNGTLRLFRAFDIPDQPTSIHYVETRMVIVSSTGFVIVHLESSKKQELPDPEDESSGFVPKRVNLRLMASYRINKDFLLCYNEFAFYVDETGQRSRKEIEMFWEGTPTSFALHEPYVLAFDPSFVEIRNIETGLMSQVIRGSNLRLLFPHVPLAEHPYLGMDAYNTLDETRSTGEEPASIAALPRSAGTNQYPSQQQHDSQGVGRDDILMVSDNLVLALRTPAGQQH